MIAVIPARGGSRRIPKKNIREFHGKPIIAYSIEAAKASKLFDRVVVSSDDPRIRIVARQCGAEAIEREEKYAYDDVGTQEVMRDALVELEVMAGKPLGLDFACCIYATAPMLTGEDLYNGLITTRVLNDYAFVPGWFYWGRPEWFGARPLGSAAPLQIVAHRYIDINTEEDWKRAEEMYSVALGARTKERAHDQPETDGGEGAAEKEKD